MISVDLDHVYRPSTFLIELCGRAQGRFMGVEAVGIVGVAHLRQGLAIGSHCKICAVIEAFQYVPLSLGALERTGWINGWSPKMHDRPGGEKVKVASPE